MSYFRLACLFATIALFLPKGEASGQYCSQNSPLSTEHVLSTFDEAKNVKGCASSRERSRQGYQVVLIRTNTTSSEVLLTITDISAQGILLVLDSPRKVNWRLSFIGPEATSFAREAVLPPGSSIIESNYELDSVHAEDSYQSIGLSPAMPDEKFATITRQHFGGLTLMAQVSEANRVSVSMSSLDRAHPSCDVSNLVAITDHAVAFSVTEQDMFGCFHSDLVGSKATDVFIIDLQAKESSDKSLPVVFFSMTSKSELKAARNMTVVLKSSSPVRWYLESWQLSGFLKIIANNGPVENHSLASGQNLNIERKPLPDDFAGLWRTVIGDTGVAPISYVRVKNANVISITLPSQEAQSQSQTTSIRSHKDMKSNFVPDRVSLHDSPVSDMNSANIQDGEGSKIRQVEADLETLVSKVCDQSATIVSLPIEAVAKFNVTGMTLNEASCQASRNSSHWVLQTLSTSCGSINYFRGSHPYMKNSIHLKFAPDSEFFGQSVSVPFHCKYPPGFYGHPVDPGDDDLDEGETSPETVEDSKMYTMKILRQRASSRIHEVLVSDSDDSAQVSVGDDLKVETYFQTNSLFSLMIEKCWVSSSPHDESRAMTGDKYLIYEGCPVHKNVSFLRTPFGENPSFTFQVTQEHRQMEEIYLFCIMGLCSPIDSFTSGNIILCQDPIEHCNASTDGWHVGPAAQQKSRRGPLKVMDKRLKVDTVAKLSSATESSLLQSERSSVSSESPSLHSAHVVMVGVPAEIAVAISVASFILGALLMGMLCCIHNRKTLPKATRNQMDAHPIETSELQPLQQQQQQQQLPSTGIQGQNNLLHTKLDITA